MQGHTLTYTFHIPGTLAANVTPVWTLPGGLTLLHVSAVATNAAGATLKLGTPDDDDALLTAQAIGQSNAPATFTAANFVGGRAPHLVAGTTLLLTLDYDGAAGTPAQNVTLVLTGVEG